MAKKKHICGNAHSFLDELFGCSKCKKVQKQRQADNVNRANDQHPNLAGWRTEANWSGRKKRQFPRGLPPEFED